MRLPFRTERGIVAPGLILLVVLVVIGALAFLTMKAVQNQSTPPTKSSQGTVSLSDFDLRIQDFLRVEVNYNPSLAQAQGFAVLTVSKGHGFIKKSIPHRLHFTLELLDQTGSVIAQQEFFPADEVEEDAYSITGVAHADTNFSPSVKLGLQVPWVTGGKSIRIVNTTGQPLLTRVLKDSETATTMQTVLEHTEQAVRSVPQQLLPQAYAQTTMAGSPNHKLTIAFIPEGYGDMAKDASAQQAFDTDVAKYIAAAKLVEPFKSRWDKDFSVTLYDKQNLPFCPELSAGQFTSTNLETQCSYNSLEDALSNVGASPDITVIVANYPETTAFSFADPNQGRIVLANSIAKQVPIMFAHELGHAIGKLFDEGTTNGTGDYLPENMLENCYAGTQTPDWHNLDTQPHNTSGCVFSNWQASQPQSLMRFSGSVAPFDAVSQFFINAWIDYYTNRSGVPTLAIDRMDLPLHFTYHAGDDYSAQTTCPSQAEIDTNRNTTPASCQYFHPIMNLHYTDLTQDQINTYANNYQNTFVTAGIGDATEFQNRVNFILAAAKQANVTPLLGLGLWKSESNFSTAKNAADLGCEPGNRADAPDFYAQVLCAYGLDGTQGFDGHTFGSYANYNYPKGFPIPFCVNGNQDACNVIAQIRQDPKYDGVPVDIPFEGFDDMWEVYGPRAPDLNGPGTTNNNCVHSYNDVMEVASKLQMCDAPPTNNMYGIVDEIAHYQSKQQSLNPGGGGGGKQIPTCPSTPNYDTVQYFGSSGPYAIQGVVVDHTSQNALGIGDPGFGCASVTLRQNGQVVASVVSSGLQSKAGHFTITNVPAGTYTLEIAPLQGWTIMQPNPKTITVSAATNGQLIFLGYQ